MHVALFVVILTIGLAVFAFSRIKNAQSKAALSSVASKIASEASAAADSEAAKAKSAIVAEAAKVEKKL